MDWGQRACRLWLYKVMLTLFYQIMKRLGGRRAWVCTSFALFLYWRNTKLQQTEDLQQSYNAELSDRLWSSARLLCPPVLNGVENAEM